MKRKTGAPAAPKTAGGAPLAPEKTAPVRVARFDAAPVIDGKLDEEVWKRAVALKDFYQIQPGDNIAPSKATEAWLGYDAKFLYFAVRAYDEPGKVRATVAKRDNVFGEDNVRIFLDTFNDQRKAYVLGFNPLGIQQDGVMTEGQGTDFSVDIVMESKGTLTADGWTLEVAIPFKSLRYEAGKDKLWGFHLWRNIDRFNDEIDSWMPISRDKSGTLNQAGHLTGLEGISTERSLELIPSLTVSETGRRVRTIRPSALARNPALLDSGRFVNQPVELDPGLSAKFGITPTVTLDFALNPDFAQVEADATVVTANQRFPIFFEEKRPFFLEGIEIFRTQIAAVHTRAIVDPDMAVKLTGKRGRNTFGLLVASDNAPGNFSEEERENKLDELQALRAPREAGESEAAYAGRLEEARRGEFQFNRVLDKNATVAVLRLKRDVGREHSIGLLATSYNFVEKHNQLGGLDGRFRLDRQTTLDVQVLGTHSRRFFYDPNLDRSVYRNGRGFAYAYNLNKSGRRFSVNVNGVGRTRDYRADVGFTRRTNTNNHNLNLSYNTEPKPKARIVSVSLYNYLGGNHDWAGNLQNWNDEFQFGLNFQRQTFFRVGYNGGYERVFESEFGANRSPARAGAFAGDNSERGSVLKNVFAYGGSTVNKKLSFFNFFGYRWGQLDFDFGNGRKFPRVSPAALADPDAPLDPGAANLLQYSLDVTYKPASALNSSLSYTKNRMTRRDTGLVAFDTNIVTLRTTYQFTRFIALRARVDYDTLAANARGQFLLGWTPNPGTAFYAGYNDDLNRDGFNRFTGQLEPGFRRNGRTFFVKMSYLFRRSF
ncbi:MAG: carbohydrate binding family 9 domain-containing protein [Acidobacteria bacterium]|nr:carbohydrate binding family 9 domain-containing protein [Acidobacteriota bacterium]